MASDNIIGVELQPLPSLLAKLQGHDYILDEDMASMGSSFSAGNYKQCLTTCQCILDFVWERLNTGHWKDIEDSWRHIYYVASHYKCLCERNCGRDVVESMRTCDLGILMGVQPAGWPSLTNVAARLNKLQERDTLTQQDVSDSFPPVTPKNLSVEEASLSGNDHTIPRVVCPSIEAFQRDYLDTATPVILTKCMDHWPALNKWNLTYIEQVAGLRTVPVEIGSRYTDINWSQQLITISEFIAKYMKGESASGGSDKSADKGYLAQHQLFDQIPELYTDICIPEYCSIGESLDPDVNAWFGPKGTISPLHQDPKSNLLCQVVGSKYIKLCHPSMSEYLYPNGGMLSNTSQVDAECLDLQQFPLVSKAKFQHAILYPGEMLYIPPKHWHYVRSLAISFSVSFWWQ